MPALLEPASGGPSVRTSRWLFIVSAALAFVPVAHADSPPPFLLKWGTIGLGDGEFEQPVGVAVSPSGDVYVAEAGNNRIQKFTSTGGFLAKWGTSGSGDGEFHLSGIGGNGGGVAVDASGNVFVADFENWRVQKFDANGGFLLKFGTPGSGDGQFFHLGGVAVDASGNVYVADSQNARIQKFDGNGAFLTKWGSAGSGDGQFSYPFGVAVDAGGNVYVSDAQLNRIQKFTSSGTFVTKWGSAGSGDGQFFGALGVSVDASGALFVCDDVNQRIQKFDSNGAFLTKWGSSGAGDGQFNFPFAIAAASGDKVYVAEFGGNRVQLFGVLAPPTPEAQIAALGDAVQALVSGGALLPSQGNSLQTKLSAGLDLLTRGNTQGALSKLNDFVKQVSSFVKTGKLTSAQGQPLIDAAQALIAQIQGSGSLAAQMAAATGSSLAMAPESLRLHPATVGPARASITLRFDLPGRADVTLEFYDLAGRRIDEVRLGYLGPGQYERSWAPPNRASGLFFYRLRAGTLIVAGKAALMN